ncbi:hypothetical protein HJC23_002031 [Cyclotella cryptica]|uniref:Uncharacterized protein n=1 Tax=Cyclotella cryptica TaxID=29204 RepID=A0ABD3P022_9STRA|eukprot:CCRYP_019434-RA/>CCRYP_019434-RA protein AED:0.02 eAED:0.02 QI:0/1/1/1/1/1/2/243/882
MYFVLPRSNAKTESYSKPRKTQCTIPLMRLPIYYYYLAASFIFAAVNYHRLIWNDEDASHSPSYSSHRKKRRNGGHHHELQEEEIEEARRLFGIAPLSAEHGHSHNLATDGVRNELIQHHDNDDDDDDDHHENFLDISNETILNEELSNDISELLYGDEADDFHNTADDGDFYSLTNYIATPSYRNDGIDTAMHDDLTDESGDDRVPSNQEGNEKDNMYHHRPKQNRVGTVWDGWPKLENEINEEDTGAAKQEGHNKHDSGTNHRKEYWWRNSKKCFDIDHICHARSTNEWFYYEPNQKSSSSSEEQSEPRHEDLFQPSMELRCEPLRYDRGLIAEERVNITVDASSRIKDMNFIDSHTFRYSENSSSSPGNKICKISQVPTHMVLQSMFNFMIGEFYARTLLPLHRLMTSFGPSLNSSSPKPWEQDIQFYVHTMHGNQKLLDGHKLLLSGMLSKEKSAEVLSMVDMFSLDHYAATSAGKNAEGGEPEEDAFMSKDCECFEKVVFCGYDIYVNENVQSMSENIPSRDDNEAATGDMPTNQTLNDTHDSNARYTLWGSSATADDVGGTGYCGKSDISKDLYSCEDWAELRSFLSSNFMNHYPSLESDVVQFRKKTLLRINLIDGDYSGDTKEWTFVGLAQRSYRRSWINLPEVMGKCNAIYEAENNKRVVCIEVNVEKTSSPYEQLLLHRSVDVLIGVHGAQLTQAVLLPPHGHVLELLPWVTDYIRGWWVQTRHTPTPLGIIFHNSDVNHVGYSLGRDSVPLCNGVGEIGSQEEKECFLKGGNRKLFIWESRDFIVKPDVILQYIHQFLLEMHDTPLECNHITNVLDGQFVLYNVWCATYGSARDKISRLNPKLTLRHYYDEIPDHLRGKGKKKQKNKVPDK